jgi:hypothetical protein
MTPTLKKLRYKPGMKIAVTGAPAGFEADLARADVTRGRKDLDLAQAFFTRRSDLERALPRLAGSLAPRGILWLCYPKGKALGTDLDRDVVRATAARAGLTAVALVAIDPVWSALRVKPSASG